jgi:hypothetical protein
MDNDCTLLVTSQNDFFANQNRVKNPLRNGKRAAKMLCGQGNLKKNVRLKQPMPNHCHHSLLNSRRVPLPRAVPAGSTAEPGSFVRDSFRKGLTCSRVPAGHTAGLPAGGAPSRVHRTKLLVNDCGHQPIYGSGILALPSLRIGGFVSPPLPTRVLARRPQTSMTRSSMCGAAK